MLGEKKGPETEMWRVHGDPCSADFLRDTARNVLIRQLRQTWTAHLALNWCTSISMRVYIVHTRQGSVYRVCGKGECFFLDQLFFILTARLAL